MGRWRCKLLYTMIVFGAGFLTAVYVLAPSSAQGSPDEQTHMTAGWSANAQTWIDKAQMNHWAEKLKTGMDKCISFAEDNALRAAEKIRPQKGQSDNTSE